MKTLILTAALVASAALSSAQHSGTTATIGSKAENSMVEVAVLQHSSDEVTLLMEKEPRESVKIKVYEGNKLLYSQRVKKEATANITYDISEFPAGDYTIDVVKDKEVVYSAKIRKGLVALAENR